MVALSGVLPVKPRDPISKFDGRSIAWDILHRPCCWRVSSINASCPHTLSGWPVKYGHIEILAICRLMANRICTDLDLGPIVDHEDGQWLHGIRTSKLLRNTPERSLLHGVRGPIPNVCLPSKNNVMRSEEHTSELQSPCNLVCRLLL